MAVALGFTAGRGLKLAGPDLDVLPVVCCCARLYGRARIKTSRNPARCNAKAQLEADSRKDDHADEAVMKRLSLTARGGTEDRIVAAAVGIIFLATARGARPTHHRFVDHLAGAWGGRRLWTRGAVANLP